MNKMQDQVLEFHEEFKLGIGKNAEFPKFRVASLKRSVDNRILRKNLIKEETRELCDALTRNDIVGVIDGACDLIYVVLGTMVECGINIEPFFNEVHRSNMDKKGGEKRADGKLLKPEDWKPPQIAEMLKAGTGVIK